MVVVKVLLFSVIFLLGRKRPRLYPFAGAFYGLLQVFRGR